jgi:hypothetical protein
MKFKEGDKVKILHRYYKTGIGWNSKMDNYIGKIVTVWEVHKDYFTIEEESQWCFPYDCADLVNPEKVYFNTNKELDDFVAKAILPFFPMEEISSVLKEQIKDKIIEAGFVKQNAVDEALDYYNIYQKEDYNKEKK